MNVPLDRGPIGMGILNVTRTPFLHLSFMLLSASPFVSFQIGLLHLAGITVVGGPHASQLISALFPVSVWNTSKTMLIGWASVRSPPPDQRDMAMKVACYDWQVSCNQWLECRKQQFSTRRKVLLASQRKNIEPRKQRHPQWWPADLQWASQINNAVSSY